MGKRGSFAIKKNKVVVLFLVLLFTSSLSYLIFANAAEVQEIVKSVINGNSASVEASPAHINYEESMKNFRGALLSLNVTSSHSFEKTVDSEKHELSVELIEPVTRQGAHLKVNNENVFLPSGGTSYIDGWLIRNRGNIKDPNGIISSNIDSFYIGTDGDCSLADHYECIDGNLHWFYCNGTDYGMVEECDSCQDNECVKKGTFARWERIKVLRQNVSVASE